MPALSPTMSREFWQDMGRLPPPVFPRAVRAVERMIENPWSTELHPEKVRQAEPGVHSCRVDESYRIIWKHIKPDDVVLCLIDKHDEAYRRAARKSFTLRDGVIFVRDILEVGARPTGEADILRGWLRPKGDSPGALFLGYRDRELLEMGVPEDVLPNIRALEDVNQLELVERLLAPAVYDRLIGVALDVVDRPAVPDDQLRQSLERHQGGDDLYKFLDSEEFKRALAGTMEEWMLFLAPAQRQLVTRDYSGPARVKGVAGSGKTVIAVHRARHLARQALPANGKVLFLTYGNRLPNVIQHLLHHLAGDGTRDIEAVECCTIHQWCYRFLTRQGKVPTVDKEVLERTVTDAIAQVRPLYLSSGVWEQPTSFFREEIQYAIKGRAIDSIDDYLALERSGRGTPLRHAERRAVYAVFEAYQSALRAQNLWDYDDFVLETLRLLRPERLAVRYVAAVVDEIQDLSEAVMRLIRRLVLPGPNDLFLVGDGLQRLYRGGYALAGLGIDIVGRSSVLTRNYRNTQEILRAAHAMMASQQFDDMDNTLSQVQEAELSVRHGELPVLRRFPLPEEELRWVSREIDRLKQGRGYQDRDFVLLYRHHVPYQDLITDLLGQRFGLVELGRDAGSYFGPGLKHTTFDSAKGLEFKVVFVVGATDGQFVPRDNWALEGEDLEDYLLRERRRLYVAMTRARDLLYVTCSRGQPSRFLADIPREYLSRQAREGK